MSSANHRKSTHRYEQQDAAYAGARYQSQFAWTLFVALAVGIAAFFQAVSPRKAILSRDSTEAFRTSSKLSTEPYSEQFNGAFGGSSNLQELMGMGRELAAPESPAPTLDRPNRSAASISHQN